MWPFPLEPAPKPRLGQAPVGPLVTGVPLTVVEVVVEEPRGLRRVAPTLPGRRTTDTGLARGQDVVLVTVEVGCPGPHSFGTGLVSLRVHPSSLTQSTVIIPCPTPLCPSSTPPRRDANGGRLGKRRGDE